MRNLTKTNMHTAQIFSGDSTLVNEWRLLYIVCFHLDKRIRAQQCYFIVSEMFNSVIDTPCDPLWSTKDQKRSCGSTKVEQCACHRKTWRSLMFWRHLQDDVWRSCKDKTSTVRGRAWSCIKARLGDFIPPSGFFVITNCTSWFIAKLSCASPGNFAVRPTHGTWNTAVFTGKKKARQNSSWDWNSTTQWKKRVVTRELCGDVVEVCQLCMFLLLSALGKQQLKRRNPPCLKCKIVCPSLFFFGNEGKNSCFSKVFDWKIWNREQRQARVVFDILYRNIWLGPVALRYVTSDTYAKIENLSRLNERAPE